MGLLRRQGDQPVAAAKRVRGAGHRLDGHAAASAIRKRVAGEHHQVRIRLVGPESGLPAVGRELDERKTVWTALEVGERVVELRRPDRTRLAKIEVGAFEGRRADLEKAQAETLAKAKNRAEKLDGLTLQITQKAGPDGRLFGSVTNYDIVEALTKQGHEVERANVRMPQGPLKQVGDVPIQIALHTDVTATITVAVLGEQ